MFLNLDELKLENGRIAFSIIIQLVLKRGVAEVRRIAEFVK